MTELEIKLTKELAEVKSDLQKLQRAVVFANSQVEFWKNRYNEETRKRFKKISEVMTSDQLDLFDEAELTVCDGACDETPEDQPVDEKKVRSYTRRKSSNAVFEVPADTPVVRVDVDVPVPLCPNCGKEMKKVGEKIFQSIVKTTSYSVIERHVPQFECMNCSPDKGEPSLITPKTGSMLEGTICDPMLLANIINNKMGMALPLYRQEQLFRFGNSSISRQVMSSWIMKTGKVLAKNLLPALENKIQSMPLVNMDETSVKVLELYDEKGGKKAPDSRSNAWMIVRCGVDGKGKERYASYQFADNRRNDTLKDFIGDYRGCLQTDGLKGYVNAGKELEFKHLGCLVHARRKAVEANSKTGKELVGLYAPIFHEEGLLLEKWRNGGYDSDSDYVEERRSVLMPLLQKLHDRAMELSRKHIANDRLQVAVNYILDYWDDLIAFLDVPYATSDNSRAERRVKPFVIARKNFLFCITPEGAEVSGLYFSLVETCKAQGIDPENYLTYLFSHAGNIPDGDVEAWSRMLPGEMDLTGVEEFREKVRLAKADPERTEPYMLRGKR